MSAYREPLEDFANLSLFIRTIRAHSIKLFYRGAIERHTPEHVLNVLGSKSR